MEVVRAMCKDPTSEAPLGVLKQHAFEVANALMKMGLQLRRVLDAIKPATVLPCTPQYALAPVRTAMVYLPSFRLCFALCPLG